LAATITSTRTLVSDYAGASQILDDTAYQVFVDLETNEYRAAAIAAVALSAYFAQKVSTTVGQVKVENQQKAEAYSRLADKYSQRAREGGGSSGSGVGVGAPGITGISIADMESACEDDDRYSSAFVRGMDDNPGVCPLCGQGCYDCGCS